MNSTSRDLTPYNGLRIQAEATGLLRIMSEADLNSLPANVHILGDGTNTIWSSPKIEKTVLKIEIPGFEVIEDQRNTVLVKVGAGENWDKTVERTVEMGLSGIEALSGIPGTVGAAPNQNIGAYGQELYNTLESVRVFDPSTNEFRDIPKGGCGFGYRDSRFKHEWKHLIITFVTLKLSRTAPTIPNYADVLKYFESKRSPTLEEIRKAILEIRSRKLPDPKVIPNCGSFFKNSIVSTEKAAVLKEKYPDLPVYPYEDMAKLSAAWLIDHAGLKGATFGPIQIYPNNALVLTAPKADAKPEDVLKARDEVIAKIYTIYDIKLEMEPELV